MTAITKARIAPPSMPRGMARDRGASMPGPLSARELRRIVADLIG